MPRKSQSKLELSPAAKKKVATELRKMAKAAAKLRAAPSITEEPINWKYDPQLGFQVPPPVDCAFVPASPAAVDTINTLLAARKVEYGDTWLVTGHAIGFIWGNMDPIKLVGSGYVHNWVQIICKAIRILATPYKLDHWRDIAGYATLVVRDLEKGEPSANQQAPDHSSP